MKTTVIYHNADYDGLFCREIAKRFLGEKDVNYIGWNFGAAKVPNPMGDTLFYILDLSPDCLEPAARSAALKENLIWIDHHKSSIEKWQADIPGYRIDGVAACRLAWQWFNLPRIGDYVCALDKQDFIDRKVSEPLAVRLAGEYDIWDKRDPRAETFQYALRASNQEDESFQSLLEPDAEPLIEEVLKLGQAAQHYAQRQDASICKHKTWLMQWEGLNFLCVNSARFNSLLFAAKDIPETGHDALLGFCFDGKCWVVSLYHARHRTDLDLSQIAIKYGGGGHRGACGFMCAILPFMGAGRF